eukprot:1137807-Pelagomonas_calceolata.AAC.10
MEAPLRAVDEGEAWVQAPDWSPLLPQWLVALAGRVGPHVASTNGDCRCAWPELGAGNTHGTSCNMATSASRSFVGLQSSSAASRRLPVPQAKLGPQLHPTAPSACCSSASSHTQPSLIDKAFLLARVGAAWNAAKVLPAPATPKVGKGTQCSATHWSVCHSAASRLQQESAKTFLGSCCLATSTAAFADLHDGANSEGSANVVPSNQLVGEKARQHRVFLKCFGVLCFCKPESILPAHAYDLGG